MNDDRRTRIKIASRYMGQTLEILDEIAQEEEKAHDNTGHVDKIDYAIALWESYEAIANVLVSLEAIVEGHVPDRKASSRSSEKKDPSTLDATRYCPKCHNQRGPGTTRCWMKNCGDTTALDRCPTKLPT
jgi:hypothetical protein